MEHIDTRKSEQPKLLAICLWFSLSLFIEQRCFGCSGGLRSYDGFYCCMWVCRAPHPLLMRFYVFILKARAVCSSRHWSQFCVFFLTSDVAINTSLYSPPLSPSLCKRSLDIIEIDRLGDGCVNTNRVSFISRITDLSMTGVP